MVNCCLSCLLPCVPSQILFTQTDLWGQMPHYVKPLKATCGHICFPLLTGTMQLARHDARTARGFRSSACVAPSSQSSIRSVDVAGSMGRQEDASLDVPGGSGYLPLTRQAAPLLQHELHTLPPGWFRSIDFVFEWLLLRLLSVSPMQASHYSKKTTYCTCHQDTQVHIKHIDVLNQAEEEENLFLSSQVNSSSLLIKIE